MILRIKRLEVVFHLLALSLIEVDQKLPAVFRHPPALANFH